MTHPEEAEWPQRPPLNVREIANWIGVSPTVTRGLLRRGDIKGFKAGGHWRALPREVALYVMRQMSREDMRENIAK